MSGTLSEEVRRRRTFAIISHPDAGKTTLTEKLLLYGGAIHLAGSVKARRAARHATSDWMQMEQERGISVTSSVLQFEYLGKSINLLDTPGHQDFSEDTYRTLMAADSAVMLLDNRKGVEEQTRKLFEVCRLRKTPVFTFVNKCDRPGAPVLQLIDDVERELGMKCYPMMWPILDGDRFLGVYDRVDERVYLFERGEDHGSSRVETHEGALTDDHILAAIPERAISQLLEDLELLEMAGAEFSEEAFLAGEVSPVFFGSALTNFGLEPFLRRFLQLAPAPGPRQADTRMVEPEETSFTGFVFKIQANMDPKHRDRIAFVRVCSGRFEAGMQVKHIRSGKPIRLASPTQFMARERTLIEEAWPGDVIGIHDRGNLRIGDTLSADGDLEFGGIPRFSPEHFARIVIGDPMKRKQLDTGLQQLSEEGAAQVFYAESLTGPAPIVGAVGKLQFDVLLHRLEHEYNVRARLEHMSYTGARWVDGPIREIERLAHGHGRMLVYDAKQKPLVLFDSEWTMRTTVDREKDLVFYDVAP
ncbi:peptide chain release factor 3 [Longimicrobium terrae]|uniref:Peptide chain release factor 3 n=1 Tax=Longimicrobium terrae TaxID=1639882 RepID=A0A841GXS6_9BACT|nr:peptide chain release factor 3 [Longimicrobium terrae]MBB4636154.1 peptide chain release factor 3 [Longimicrobium terrae]MBB6070549.1 peptide chain release factor 3 [Longimicrobium terrae]NNC29535.1 peptide chain release factor 3 [Longimicrobium terrae]